jgi:GH35 family endo-1,4-beta-xylanase
VTREDSVLRFDIGTNGHSFGKNDLDSAYLFGADSVPLRADIETKKNAIICKKRTAGPAGLALLWEVEGFGKILLETTRLLERDAPYVLTVELARGQLMRIIHKREEWGLFDLEDVAKLNGEVRVAAGLLVEAMQADTTAKAAAKGAEALAHALRVSEDLTSYHAYALLDRRKQTGGFPRHIFGCQIDIASNPQTCGPLVADAFDFASLPVRWKDTEPTERKYQWKQLDAWVDWLTKHKIPLKASELLCFRDNAFPDWLLIWKHDFDTVRTLATEYVRRVVSRYSAYIQVWDIISGVHAPQSFVFNFEQLMDLTRIAAGVTKQVAPRATTVVDVVAPWGEYYARDQRSIPPMLYVDMAIQSGIAFDGIGLQFQFGANADGMYVRDMFQISSIIERFGALGKPIHVTAVQVPSSAPDDSNGGRWRAPWNESTQSRWLQAFYEVALSKPFVETVTWEALSDLGQATIPNCGLVDSDLRPKKAYKQLVKLRREISPDAGKK